MFKRCFLSFLALLILTLSLTGCNKKSQYDDGTSYEEYDLVVALFTMLDLDSSAAKRIGDKLAEDHGLKIKYICFEGEDEIRNLDTMLMAGDTKIDVFFSSNLDVGKYIRHGYYTDLSQFENLKSLIESNNVVRYAVDFDGEYIAIPTTVIYDHKQKYLYMSPALLTYFFENIDAFTGTYSDPDGEKLFEVFKHIYQNNGDEVEYPLEHVDFTCVVSEGYVMMSPFAEHKDVASLYLEYVFDYFKDAPPYPYPENDDVSFENAYLNWRSMHYYVREPITLAVREELLKTDGSDEALRELAREAARQVRMRLEG